MKSLVKLFVFMRPFLWMIILAVVLTGCLTMIGMAQPLLMRRLINDVAKEGKWGIFPLVMTLLFAVPVLRASVNTANSLTLKRVGLGMIANTRKRMFGHLMRLSMRFYNETPVGSISQRLMGDVGTISNVTTSGIITLTQRGGTCQTGYCEGVGDEAVCPHYLRSSLAGRTIFITSFSVMGGMAEVQHAASLFLGLDQRSEQASCMSYYANWRTRILIATSRLSICKDADMVVVMQNGKIAQIGRHEELLATPGLYRRMYMRQMGIEELDAASSS